MRESGETAPRWAHELLMCADVNSLGENKENNGHTLKDGLYITQNYT
jgi:hypothetical protein